MNDDEKNNNEKKVKTRKCQADKHSKWNNNSHPEKIKVQTKSFIRKAEDTKSKKKRTEKQREREIENVSNKTTTRKLMNSGFLCWGSLAAFLGRIGKCWWPFPLPFACFTGDILISFVLLFLFFFLFFGLICFWLALFFNSFYCILKNFISKIF